MASEISRSPAARSHAVSAGSVDEPWELLRETHHLLRSRWTELLERVDLSVSEYLVLELCEAGPARASEIAHRIGITPAGATDLIDRLESRDLVRRVADPADRRAARVQLVHAAKSAKRSIVHSLDLAMTDSERRALSVGLSALTRALRPGRPSSTGGD
jgi:DNA-binding MarR family transcriptional regulator